MIFLVPGVVLLARFSGMTGMLWAGPIADVLSILLTVLLVVLELKGIHKMEKNQQPQVGVVLPGGGLEAQVQ